MLSICNGVVATVIQYSVLYIQHCFLRKPQSVLRKEWNLIILSPLSLDHFPTSAELDFAYWSKI